MLLQSRAFAHCLLSQKPHQTGHIRPKIEKSTQIRTARPHLSRMNSQVRPQVEMPMLLAPSAPDTDIVTGKSGALIRNFGSCVPLGVACEWRPKGVAGFSRGLRLSQGLAIELPLTGGRRLVAWTSVPAQIDAEPGARTIYWAISTPDGDYREQCLIPPTRGPSPKKAFEKLFTVLGMSPVGFKFFQRLSFESIVVQALIERSASIEGSLPTGWMPAFHGSLVDARYLSPVDEKMLPKLDTDVLSTLSHLMHPATRQIFGPSDSESGSPPRKMQWGQRRRRSVRCLAHSNSSTSNTKYMH